MDTIILFHRYYLTHSYMLMAKVLKGKFNFVHLAYSNDEVEIIKKYDPSAEITVYVEEISKIYQRQSLDMSLINKIDNLFWKESSGRFTLNMSINGDRTAHLLSYNEVLLLAQTYYVFWRNIFSKVKAQFLFHETASAFFVHFCSMMCRSYGVKHIFPFRTFIPHTLFYFQYEEYKVNHLEERYLYYKSHPEKIDIEKCRKYLDDFRASYEILDSNMVEHDKSILQLYLNATRTWISHKVRKNKFDRVIQTIDYFGLVENPDAVTLKNILAYKKRIQFMDIDENDNFYFYPLHYEPEATVEYLADGYYSNQIKLIQNIAAQIPAGCYLYVKDHPHYLGYRDYHDYERLQRLPNVKLIDRNVSARKIMKLCKGVFTINGSAGFEAIMLGKPVFCFGQSYYSFYDGAKYIHNVKNIKDLFHPYCYEDIQPDNSLYAYLFAYMQSSMKGDVYLWSYDNPPSDEALKQSAKDMADSFIDYINQ